MFLFCMFNCSGTVIFTLKSFFNEDRSVLLFLMSQIEKEVPHTA